MAIIIIIYFCDLFNTHVHTFFSKHGDPLLEAAQEEFSRSEEFFEGVDESGETKKKKRDLFAEEEEDYGAEEKPQEKKITIGEQPLEDIDAETIADEEELEYEREERKTDAILDRLEQQDSADLAYGWVGTLPIATTITIATIIF